MGRVVMPMMPGCICISLQWIQGSKPRRWCAENSAGSRQFSVLTFTVDRAFVHAQAFSIHGTYRCSATAAAKQLLLAVRVSHRRIGSQACIW